jgi:hypothetical protein
MAYQGGGLLKFIRPDLTTRLGAQSAMDSAKFCFLLVAGCRIVFYLIAGVGVGFSGAINALGATAVLLVVLAVDIAPPLVAAWRLHVYKGAFVTPVVTVLYFLGILSSMTPASIVIGILFTAVFVGGIRGAWALRRDTGFEDDYAATFN